MPVEHVRSSNIESNQQRRKTNTTHLISFHTNSHASIVASRVLYNIAGPPRVIRAEDDDADDDAGAVDDDDDDNDDDDVVSEARRSSSRPEPPAA